MIGRIDFDVLELQLQVHEPRARLAIDFLPDNGTTCRVDTFDADIKLN
jgi:hypothetical protein